MGSTAFWDFIHHRSPRHPKTEAENAVHMQSGLSWILASNETHVGPMLTQAATTDNGPTQANYERRCPANKQGQTETNQQRLAKPTKPNGIGRYFKPTGSGCPLPPRKGEALLQQPQKKGRVKRESYARLSCTQKQGQ